ncbi:DUF3990 domain-containing protein [Paludibacter sp. 221]|uniref:DUF3990 domain-containing protein n=1 Tax=Paludibacter sp. 221 TaxID=2302939 RepID=UPI0013D09100|nr:DUF3990 domain-containing protein [Paludibacter sp. 221]NDV47025.1 DUF3990 domain-containing protein [Paludibacter sp. 221]
MKLYHGSVYHIKTPDIRKGRDSVDFGKGFYTTLNFEQAKRWALNKEKTAGKTSSAVVSVYDMPDTLLTNKNYNIRLFNAPDEDWLTFVINCRKGITHEYDIVFGPVADDRIYATITLFESGVLTAEATIAQLRINEVFNQISFHSGKAIKELLYIKSLTVKEDTFAP